MSDLLGARVLAWTGGAVTLLGIVFFFVLAVNRGLIGPEVRVGCGALASGLVVGVGFWLRSRQGESYAALAAVGAGIAGGYATVLAAAGLYDLVSDTAALVIAASIATVGVAISLIWSAQPVAGLGLVGAMGVPVLIGLGGGGLTLLGTAFVAIVLAATAVVAVLRRWRYLLQAGVAASLPQVIVLIAQADAGTPAQLMTVATLFWLVYVAAAIGWQVRHAERGMQPLTGTLALAGVALAYGAAARLYSGADRGWILLADATMLTVAGVMLFSRRASRDLSSLLWASGAALAAIGIAELLSGPSLALVWSAQAALLAWLSVRAREPRLLLASAGYLMLAFVHVLTVDSPPADLFVSGQVAASGLVALTFVVCAALVFAIYVRAPGSVPPSEPHGVYQHLARTLARARPLARSCAVWSGASAALYGACLAVVALSTLLISDDRVAFERGHAGVTALISAVALAAFVAASGRTRRQLAVGALITLAAAAVKVVTFDRGELPDHLLGISLVAVGAGSVLMGLVQQRSVDYRERANPLAMLLVGWSVACCVPAALIIGEGSWNGINLHGASLFVLALGYALLAGVAFSKERDLFSVLAALSLTLAAIGAALILSSLGLMLALTLGAAGLALLARTTREPRLLLAAAAYLVTALGHAIAFDAPLRDLFTVQPKPAHGVPSLMLVAAAALALASQTLHRHDDRPFRFGRQLPQSRSVVLWLSAVVIVYAASLELLFAAQSIAGSDPEVGFLVGQVAVNALWALVSLALLVTGLVRRLPALRIGGWVWLGATLAKLCLFDFSRAGGDSRYVSLMIVGFTGLLAGFLDQLLGDERRRLRLLPAAAIVVGAAMASVGLIQLLDRPLAGVDPDGVALLITAVACGALAVIAFRLAPDLSALLWGIGMACATLGASEALSGGWLVLAWAATAVVLVPLARKSRELRLLLASAALVGAAAIHTLVLDAPPSDLFVASPHPGTGVPSLLYVVFAGLVLARAAGRENIGGLTSAPEARRTKLSVVATIAGGVGLLYAASLAALEVAQVLATGESTTSFQRGHTGVSALWGFAGLALLYLGLRSHVAVYRIAGLAVFAVSLTKLFVYDLTFLSSITRALSFLAVGFLLLLGGFIYQRLSAEPDPGSVPG